MLHFFTVFYGLQGEPYITANLYYICLSEHETYVLKQMQYKFAVIYETLRIVFYNLL